MNSLIAFTGLSLLFGDERFVFCIVCFIHSLVSTSLDAIPSAIRNIVVLSSSIASAMYLLLVIICLAFQWFDINEVEYEIKYALGFSSFSVIGIITTTMVNVLICQLKLVHSALKHPNDFSILRSRITIKKVGKEFGNAMVAASVLKEAALMSVGNSRMKKGNKSKGGSKIKPVSGMIDKAESVIGSKFTLFLQNMKSPHGITADEKEKEKRSAEFLNYLTKFYNPISTLLDNLQDLLKVYIIIYIFEIDLSHFLLYIYI